MRFHRLRYGLRFIPLLLLPFWSGDLVLGRSADPVEEQDRKTLHKRYTESQRRVVELMFEGKFAVAADEAEQLLTVTAKLLPESDYQHKEIKVLHSDLERWRHLTPEDQEQLTHVLKQMRLSELNFEEEKYGDAESIASEALALLRETDSEAGWASSRLLGFQALSLMKQRRFCDAAIHLQALHQQQVEALGTENRRTAHTLRAIGKMEAQMRRYDKSVKSLTSALEILEDELTENHGESVVTLCLIVSVRIRQRESLLESGEAGAARRAEQEARKLAEKVFELVKSKKVPADHRAAISHLFIVGTALTEQKHYDEAMPILEYVLQAPLGNILDAPAKELAHFLHETWNTYLMVYEFSLRKQERFSDPEIRARMAPLSQSIRNQITTVRKWEELGLEGSGKSQEVR